MKQKAELQKAVDTVLQMANRYLDERLEDMNSGVSGDKERYHSETTALVLALARPVILAEVALYLSRMNKK